MRQSGIKYGAVRSLFVLMVATTMVGFVGCNSGPEMGEVTGTVTLDGQPVSGLEVNFDPIDSNLGTTATGYTQAGGEYELFYPGMTKGAPAGDYTVRIVAAEVDEPTDPPLSIPPKYNVESELKATVTAGAQTHNFELTSK